MPMFITGGASVFRHYYEGRARDVCTTINPITVVFVEQPTLEHN